MLWDAVQKTLKFEAPIFPENERFRMLGSLVQKTLDYCTFMNYKG
jgi:hypothetical protein